jgi:hypothetical protein
VACATLDPKPAYGLPTLIDGKSEATTVDAPLRDLLMGGYAFNRHKSVQEASIYVYRGEISQVRETRPRTDGGVPSAVCRASGRWPRPDSDQATCWS